MTTTKNKVQTQFFKPDDFDFQKDPLTYFVITAKFLADFCNDKLEAEALRVYGWIDSQTWSGRHTDNTHTALLIDIQPLKKEPCEHEPMLLSECHSEMPPLTIYNCRHCGAKLKAKWEAAEE